MRRLLVVAGLLAAERESLARIAERRWIFGWRWRTAELFGRKACKQNADTFDQSEQYAADDCAASHRWDACNGMGERLKPQKIIEENKVTFKHLLGINIDQIY